MHFQSVITCVVFFLLFNNWCACMLFTVHLQAYLRVTVDVIDVNDPPRFADQQETIAVTEVSNRNTCVSNY